MNSRDDFHREEKDAFYDEGCRSVGALDDHVRECKCEFPDIVGDATAHVCGVMFGKDVPTYTSIKLFITMMKNSYRAGYLAGSQDLQTKITANQNRG